jgi:hypothetical protein
MHKDYCLSLRGSRRDFEVHQLCCMRPLRDRHSPPNFRTKTRCQDTNCHPKRTSKC